MRTVAREFGWRKELGEGLLVFSPPASPLASSPAADLVAGFSALCGCGWQHCFWGGSGTLLCTLSQLLPSWRVRSFTTCKREPTRNPLRRLQQKPPNHYPKSCICLILETQMLVFFSSDFHIKNVKTCL